jgi:hypothetical protein
VSPLNGRMEWRELGLQGVGVGTCLALDKGTAGVCVCMVLANPMYVCVYVRVFVCMLLHFGMDV